MTIFYILNDKVQRLRDGLITLYIKRPLTFYLMRPVALSFVRLNYNYHGQVVLCVCSRIYSSTGCLKKMSPDILCIQIDLYSKIDYFDLESNLTKELFYNVCGKS